jgi:glycosyltransferase involved in cell wall biosynthesis
MAALTPPAAKKIALSPGGTYVFGKEVVMSFLMAGLAERNWEVLAVLTGWNDGRYPAMLTAQGVRHVEIKLGFITLSHPTWTLDTLVHLPGAIAAYLTKVRPFRPQFFVHTDCRRFHAIRALCPAYTRHIMHVHDDDLLLSRNPLVRHALESADAVICVSEFIRRQFDGVVDPARIHVVHNGLPPVHLEGTRAEPRPPFRFGIVGQVIPRKRHGLLVDALAVLADQGLLPSVEVHVFGDDGSSYAETIKGALRRGSLDSHVRWHGYVATREKIYDSIDVLLAPAVNEPFGTTVLEAACYEVPSIAARSGGFPEMIVDTQTGLLIEPDDASALAAAMKRFVEQPHLVRALGQKAGDHVQTQFTVGKMAAAFEEALVKAG